MRKYIFFIACLLAGSFSCYAETRELTLSIIKPSAVEDNYIGKIISKFEEKGLTIAGMKMVRLTKEQAAQFYAVHKDRPFFPQLIQCMTSGPVVVMVLKGNNAILLNREIMGATDPSKAKPGTIRAECARSVTENAVHGSDSPETAKQEIDFFFQSEEILK